MPSFKPFVFLGLAVVLSVGCASYQHKVRDARRAMDSGDFEKSAKLLAPLAKEPSRDQLIYLMDYGLALHLAGKYKESNQIFLQADQLAEFQDYHSVSKITASLLFSEEMVQYKGEHYENLLIHVYLAKNFILLGDMDAALVEIRRINEIMEKYRIDEKVFEGQNVLAHYFSGILWESQKNYDAAVIEYEKAYKLRPGIGQLQEDLLRANFLSERMERYRELKKIYPDLDQPEIWKKKNTSEVVVFFTQGWAPRKRPHVNSPRFPQLEPVRSVVKSARVRVDGVGDYESSTVYSVENVAMNTLAKDYDELVAKRLAGIAAKAVVADQIRQKNQLLGDLSWIAMNIADRADLRQWSSLPESFQIVRVPLDPGSYSLTLEGISHSGVPIAQRAEQVELRVGESRFLIWRTFE